MGRKRWGGGSFFAAHLATTTRGDVRAFGHSVVDNNGATPSSGKDGVEGQHQLGKAEAAAGEGVASPAEDRAMPASPSVGTPPPAAGGTDAPATARCYTKLVEMTHLQLRVAQLYYTIL